ncbi:MAG: hypothetical protein LBS51_08145 [Oscillospiraceae bacterium]|jgi:hypothetical protein|nr:hypothetical protein [Oscillospiraceae bacterium]
MTQERFRVQKKAGSRLLALLLAFALAASLLPISASADVGEMNEMAAQFEENLAAAQEIMDDGGFLAPIGEVAVDSVAISNRAELEAITSNLAGTYHLTADIDLSDTEWIPIGDSENPFSGVFDGQGHKISNLTITGDSYQYNGLFGYVRDATIKNVGMVGTNINVSSSSSAGGIAGIAYASESSSLTIENCYNTGDVSSLSSSSSTNAGGIAGEVYTSSVAAGHSSDSDIGIANCYNTGTVSASSSSSSYASVAGGIVGRAYVYHGFSRD